MVPCLLGKRCSFPLVPMWIWWHFSCLEHYRTHQGCGTPIQNLDLRVILSHSWCLHLCHSSGSSVPTSPSFLCACDQKLTQFSWWHLGQKWHIFEPYCQQICLLMEKKKSLFRLFCFLPRQESSFCLYPLAQRSKWRLQHKKPISTNKNYFFGSAVYWHSNYNVVTFFFCNRCLTHCIDAVDGCLFLRLLSAEEIKWT